MRCLLYFKQNDAMDHVQCCNMLTKCVRYYANAAYFGLEGTSRGSGLSWKLSRSYNDAIWSPFCSSVSMTSRKWSARTFRLATFDAASIIPYCSASSRYILSAKDVSYMPQNISMSVHTLYNVRSHLRAREPHVPERSGEGAYRHPHRTHRSHFASPCCSRVFPGGAKISSPSLHPHQIDIHRPLYTHGVAPHPSSGGDIHYTSARYVLVQRRKDVPCASHEYEETACLPQVASRTIHVDQRSNGGKPEFAKAAQSDVAHRTRVMSLDPDHWSGIYHKRK